MQATRPSVETTALSVTVEAVTEIDAPVAEAWDVLADTDSYGSWNPFVTRFDGPLVEGGRIEVVLQLEGRTPQTMRPRLVRVDQGSSFEWLGRFGPRGIFDGRHRFTLRPLAGDRCELVQSEVLSGILVPAFRKMLTGPTPDAFVALNEAFKQRVESRG